MKFVPYLDKIVVKPFVVDSVIKSQQDSFQEMGEVTAVGELVTFVKPGDILYFLPHGCWKTAKSPEGIEYYVVSQDQSFILGKHVAE